MSVKRKIAQNKTTNKTKEQIDLKAFVPRVAAWLAMSRDAEATEKEVERQFGLSKLNSVKVVKLAKEHLALAADVDLRLELGKRREQLDDLLQRARAVGDLAVELRTLQEMSKLSNVYSAPTVFETNDSAESPADALARSHLEGLNLTAKGLPIEELSRQIASIVLSKLDASAKLSTSETKGKRRIASRKNDG